MEKNFIRSDETYKIIGIFMEIHRVLGGGLREIVYKDALEYEFRQQHIPFEREKEYPIEYKGVILPHRFYADFVVFGDLILEVKAITRITTEHLTQTINYIQLAKSHVGLIVNFHTLTMQHRRIVA